MADASYTLQPGDILVRDGKETAYEAETTVPRSFFQHGDVVRHPHGGVTVWTDDRNVLYGFKGNTALAGLFPGAGEVGELTVMRRRAGLRCPD